MERAIREKARCETEAFEYTQERARRAASAVGD